MQATIGGSALGSRRARLLLVAARHHRPPRRRARLHAATPLITPDPPWLSDVPVVFAIMMLLIIIGLLHRIQSEPEDCR